MSDQPPVTATEFHQLCEFLYRRTGMRFTEAKRYYVERRIKERMSATGATSFAGYFALLRSDFRSEAGHLVNALTVNETFFYREDYQLRCLTADLLARRIAAKPRGEPLRIWSVPCSTGEEPYSMAMWLLENWPEVDAYDIEIVGSDIDTQVLETARRGTFGKRALMRLSLELIAKYFIPIDAHNWQIIEELRQSIHFSPVNLIDPAGMRAHGRFDVIFCRNALIYFDDGSRRIAAENLYDNLMPGGYICLGHTESMSRISPLFEVCRFSDAIVYQRPADGA